MKKILTVWAAFLAAASVRAACFTTSGTPAGAGITAVLTPSRVGGVAPLAVFFDSTGTVASSTLRPFHELSYCWDFGDPGSGSFVTDGKSKNEARGPAAGHIFETPGVYNVTMIVRDGQDREAVQSVTITVQDPDVVFAGANTRCFSSSGDFTGCPAGAQQVLVTGLSGLSSHMAPGRRLLLRRGDTFASTINSASLRIDMSGPGLIGAFGSGARPVLKIDPSATGFGPIFYVSGNNGAFSDWRFVDLELDGSGAPNSNGFYFAARGDHALILRCYAHDIMAALRTSGGFLTNGVTDVLAVQDSEFLRSVDGGNLAYLAMRRFLLLGNVMSDSTQGEHILRVPWIILGVISHNDMGQQDAGRHTIKMHAPIFNATSPRYSEYVVISENIFRGTTKPGANNWNLALGPEGDTFDERVRQLIVERNFFLNAGTAIPLVIWAPDVTARDNVLFRGNNSTCIAVGPRDSTTPPTPGVDTEPQPSQVHLIHNTCYGTGSFSFAGVSGGLVDIRAANNLLVGSSNMGSGYAVSVGNLSAANPGAAGLAAAVPATAADFMLGMGSSAIGAGDPAYRSLWDHSGAQRTDAAPDAGAWESAGPPDPLPPARPRNLRVR